MKPIITFSQVLDLLMWMAIFGAVIIALALIMRAFESFLYGIAHGIRNLILPPSRRKILVRGRTVSRSQSEKPLAKELNEDDFPWHDPRACIRIIDRMNGFEFEKFLGLLFTKLGYQVEVTPEIKDHGADLIITDSQGRRFAVQAKKLASGRVSAKALGELFRGLYWYKCNGGIVLTNRFFTEQAEEEAKRLNIALWDRPKLIELIKKAHQASQNH